MLDTFIFDLDGVVVNTAKYHFLAWKRLAAEVGYNFSQSDNEQFKDVNIYADSNMECYRSNFTDWRH